MSIIIEIDEKNNVDQDHYCIFDIFEICLAWFYVILPRVMLTSYLLTLNSYMDVNTN